ncbi:MAG: methylmalonyl-CoA epimerase [FCB group bacterium]|nr:methylmalonyl-CoA epimerase [FCB group bacterium]
MTDSMISHIGIAVADLEKAIDKYRLILGDIDVEKYDVSDQKVKVALISKSYGQQDYEGGVIELLTPTSPESKVAKYLEKKGEGLHHICLYVENIEQKLSELKKAGVRLIDETPRRGAEGNLIAFIHPISMDGVLIELEEKVT